jgi:NADPH:quinone reductase-like Zn-dependent oxidoreductase
MKSIWFSPAGKLQAINEIAEHLTNNRLIHRIAETHILENTTAAHEAIEKGATDGSIVIEIE